jgi:hypothetical protein
MATSGTLVTRVFTGRGELPVAGATISVVRREDGGQMDLLSVQVSDAGGDTVPIVIETPHLDLSQSPGSPAPFAVVDIWADRQGFELLVIEDVQIFPGVTSLQDLPLIPRPEGGGRGGETVEITPQDL